MSSVNRLLCWSLIISGFISLNALGKDKIPHQRGIELRGGYSMYLDMTDPNQFNKDFTGTTGYSQKEYSESAGTLGGGISLLYKTADYFCWHIGLNVLATDSATATAVNALNETQVSKIYVNATEIFLTVNYYLNVTPRFNLQIGAGPAFYLASMDKSIPSVAESVYGTAFYDAHGRSFGFLGTAGLEFFLSNAISLKFGGGFRWAPISRFKYFVEYSSPTGNYKEGEIAYWHNSWDTFEADFSGGFAEIGLRVYFEPATQWKKYDAE
ncbi:MAG: hypothetical protein ABH878_04345 [bacterium]